MLAESIGNSEWIYLNFDIFSFNEIQLVSQSVNVELSKITI